MADLDTSSHCDLMNYVVKFKHVIINNYAAKINWLELTKIIQLTLYVINSLGIKEHYNLAQLFQITNIPKSSHYICPETPCICVFGRHFMPFAFCDDILSSAYIFTFWQQFFFKIPSISIR